MANILRCKKCGDIITSDERHDMNWCKCGAIAIDGGNDYCKITGNPEDIEMFVPSKLLDEKEEETARLKLLVDGFDKLKQYDKDADLILINPKTCYTDGKEWVVKVDNQDKISFAVDRLEKVKECINTYNKEHCFLSTEIDTCNKSVEFIDNQINQLKEK